MYDFLYDTPTKVYFGKGSFEKLGGLIKERKIKKILLHYGGKSAQSSGLLDRVRAALKQTGVPFCELGGVVPNPRLALVEKGIAICREQGADFILAVGGGSVIDSAKAIGMGVYCGGEVWDFYVGKRKPEGCLPIGVVLTISASGSEMSNSSVITNEDGRQKRGVNEECVRPAFAVCDPTLTYSVNAYQTACGCTDILMHTMERYFVSGEVMRLTDGIAEALMRTVLYYSPRALKNPDDYTARAELMWAGSLSHNGLTGCGNCGGDWTVHRMEHELSGLFDVPHGAGLAAIWGSWARYVYMHCINRFHNFAVYAMGIRPSGTREEVALKGIIAFEEFLTSIGMPTNLKELGISPTEEQLRQMAASAAAAWGGVKGSALPLAENDVYQILKAAL